MISSSLSLYFYTFFIINATCLFKKVLKVFENTEKVKPLYNVKKKESYAM